MKYEVINISTSTERYIANGVLTHNKFIGGGCPSGVTYTSQGVQATVKRPFLFYQSSYIPSLPITVTYTNNIDTTYNYFTFEDSNGINWCYGSTSYPMTKTTFRSGSVTVTGNATNQKMTYLPASYGWQSNYFVSFSVSTLTGVGDPGTFYWSALLSATDASSRAATNNYPGTGYSIVTGNLSVPCLTPDTLIELIGGKTVFLKNIEVGEVLTSIDPETGEYEESIVTSKTFHKVDELYLLNNGVIRCSKYHKHIVKRENLWVIITSDQLLLGDIMMNKDTEEIIIDKIETLN
jgi:hypothetical protein